MPKTSTEIKIRPLGDKVVIKPAPREEMTKSGIVLPDTAKEKPERGTVVAVGPGRTLDSGQKVPIDLKVGDVVYFQKYGPSEIKIDDEEYLICGEKDILAVVG